MKRNRSNMKRVISVAFACALFTSCAQLATIRNVEPQAPDHASVSARSFPTEREARPDPEAALSSVSAWMFLQRSPTPQALVQAGKRKWQNFLHSRRHSFPPVAPTSTNKVIRRYPMDRNEVMSCLAPAPRSTGSSSSSPFPSQADAPPRATCHACTSSPKVCANISTAASSVIFPASQACAGLTKIVRPTAKPRT